MSNRFLLLFGLLSIAACDALEHHEPDGAWTLDAALVDGSGLLDGGTAAGEGGVSRGDASAASDAGAASACGISMCDPRSPDCPDGRCVLWGAVASCEEAAGSYASDAPCETVTECAPGLACFQSDAGGVCGRVCCPSDELACTGDAVCGGGGVLVDGTETSWGRCLPPRSCDVLRPAEVCAPREGCYILDTSGRAECRVAGTAGAGEACAAQSDCQAGFFCGGITPNQTCVRICRLGAGDCPSDEGRCVAQAHSPAGSGFCTADALRY